MAGIKELEGTWVIIAIGSRKYAINNKYIQSIVDLEKSLFKEPYYKNTFIKGVYDIHGALVSVLDGRKLIRESTVDEDKLYLASKIYRVKNTIEVWLDNYEWGIIMREAVDDVDIEELLKACKEIEDSSLDNLILNIKEAYTVIKNRADRLLENRKDGKSSSETMEELNKLRLDANKYILKPLDRLIRIANDRLNEMCIVVKANGISYGISIDFIDMITEKVGGIENIEKTRLSAGTITIQDEVYNILNLTKLSKVVA